MKKNKLIRIYLGNSLKSRPTNIFIDKLNFGISLFGGWKLAIIKSWWNNEYDCRSFKIIWHTKK